MIMTKARPYILYTLAILFGLWASSWIICNAYYAIMEQIYGIHQHIDRIGRFMPDGRRNTYSSGYERDYDRPWYDQAGHVDNARCDGLYAECRNALPSHLRYESPESAAWRAGCASMREVCGGIMTRGERVREYGEYDY